MSEILESKRLESIGLGVKINIFFCGTPFRVSELILNPTGHKIVKMGSGKCSIPSWVKYWNQIDWNRLDQVSQQPFSEP